MRKSSLKSTGERVIPEEGSSEEKYCGHLIFYDFASKYAKSGVILDDGCGTGYGTSFLLSSAQHTVAIGIDRSLDAIVYANQHNKHPRVGFLASDGEKLPFADEMFDVVVSTQVIEHVVHCETYLSEIVRVIKDSGILLMGTPNKLTFNPHGSPMPFHFKEFNFEEFSELLHRYFRHIETFGQYNLKKSGKRSVRDTVLHFGKSLLLSWISSTKRVKVGRAFMKMFGLSESYSLQDFRIREFNPSTSMNIICICSIKKSI